MIYLKKGQKLFENPGMVVYGDTGYYNDGDVVICAPVYSPDEPACGYEAKYIAYGTIVYGMTDENKLAEELKKIDPESLFGKTQEEVKVEKLIEKIQTVDNPTPELTPETITDSTPESVVETQPEPTPEIISEPSPEVVPESTPEVVSESIPEVVSEPALEPVIPEPAVEIIPEPVPENLVPEIEVAPIIEPEPEAVVDSPVSMLIRKSKRKLG